ncbi:MAG: hypothetical protein N2258_04355, partial [Brevinematales bacterium]|nr:hypothetical protein [Brevinematales bacterium]
EIIKTFLLYLYNVTDIKPERVGYVLGRIETKGEEVAMSTAEVLIKKGIEQGLNRGSYETKIQTAKKMLWKGFDVDLISDVTGLSIEEIEELKEKM